ncbi:hypothetical protein D915_006641 [Fasciola hepatica]|uniref:Uncharacterized protein n=1 Tax=Fasciola hepatica TaxID=6192 RepID=A0A4E0R666_FASHE|nr:hypothetical protein D915_006641 [Fasciola hepatica]
MSELQKHVHLTILGYVFKVPLDDPIFGLHGPNASLTGRDGTHLVLGEKEESRYALDGVGTRALADLLRWVQFLSPRYQCVGHLPGAYFDPMGDPTDYLQSIFMIWKQIIHDQFTLLVTFPRCHPYETGEGLTYVTCHDEIKPDGERVQRRPRLLFESSRRTPRCACASVGLLNSLTNLVNYPQCPPTSSKCLLSTQVN